MDEQYDIFGGSTMVGRQRTRPAPAPARAEQMALFASDANELDGQEATVDLFGALVEGGAEQAAAGGELQAGDIVRHIGNAVIERITVARAYGVGGNRRIEGVNQDGREVIRRADRYELVKGGE